MEPRIDGNEGVIYIPKSSRTGTSASDIVQDAGSILPIDGTLTDTTTLGHS